MLANLIIGLREGLEAALVVGLILAAVHRIGRSDLVPRIWLGVGLAAALSLATGAVLTFGTATLDRRAQEFVTGVLSLLAVALVTWMIIWMATTASTLRHRIDADVSHAVAGSGRTLAVLAFLAVAREGTETALFLWASTSTSDAPIAGVAGALLGLGIAIGLGWLLFRRLVRIDLGRFFAWTGALLVLIAAGVLAYGLHELQEVGMLPGPDQAAPAGAPAALAWLWGTAFTQILPAGSLPAAVLTGAFGIAPTMTWLQVVAWVGYVAIVMTIFVRTIRARRRPAAPSAPDSSTARALTPTSAGAPV